MTENRNGKKRETFLILIPKGKESEFLTYKKVCRELGTSINSRRFSKPISLAILMQNAVLLLRYCSWAYLWLQYEENFEFLER